MTFVCLFLVLPLEMAEFVAALVVVGLSGAWTSSGLVGLGVEYWSADLGEEA